MPRVNVIRSHNDQRQQGGEGSTLKRQDLGLFERVDQTFVRQSRPLGPQVKGVAPPSPLSGDRLQRFRDKTRAQKCGTPTPRRTKTRGSLASLAEVYDLVVPKRNANLNSNVCDSQGWSMEISL